jgi:hypothetical protein
MVAVLEAQEFSLSEGVSSLSQALARFPYPTGKTPAFTLIILSV